ncbi:ATP-binding cassette domain-containing protein [Cronobacter sakazakii]|nr:ATP-binding cassette domain-containing protein [Cronobacter sakazakii]ELY5805011.1 ATP-binding cassette domain-containing protein [Cronobacter sakazakii]ELY5855632.1 ATP-binding cassette domain-containing protein [Cronobacter malonaticus]
MIDLSINEKTFGDRVLFSEFQINIKPGDFLVLTGASGTGKSTLLNILGLLDINFKGDYLFCKEKININSPEKTSHIRRKNFGYIFQDSLINNNQNVIRNLLCAVDYKNHKIAKDEIAKTLHKVGLPNVCLQASVLSGGEKQRLALARALIKKPSVLFADEPTASLDKDNKYKVMNILSDFHEHGGTVIMITHDTQLITNKMKVLHID